MAEAPKKKVVRVDETPAEKAAEAAGAGGGTTGATWTPTAEAKKKATTFRIIAIVLWLLAIGTEAFTIFYVLKQNPISTVLLIVGLVVIAGLASGGSLLWKQSNRLDPASKSEPVRFFVQNQLGVIISAIAFIPLIILIFTNKNMSGQQKALTGVIAIVLLAASGTIGASVNPPSTEQYTSETQQVVAANGGQDLVYWTKSGKVFHLCAAVSAVNLQSKDNKIYSGTVAEAHAAGKPRLTLQIDQERKQCGFDVTPEAT